MKRSESHVKNELAALLRAAQGRIDEGYYGIAESTLKRALECLDEASQAKLNAETKESKGDSKVKAKIKKLLANIDINPGDTSYDTLLAEGVAAREYGLTYKRIEIMLDESVNNIPPTMR